MTHEDLKKLILYQLIILVISALICTILGIFVNFLVGSIAGLAFFNLVGIFLGFVLLYNGNFRYWLNRML